MTRNSHWEKKLSPLWFEWKRTTPYGGCLKNYNHGVAIYLYKWHNIFFTFRDRDEKNYTLQDHDKWKLKIAYKPNS